MRTHTTRYRQRSTAPRPFFQAKLTVNTPGDVYEQEADRVADQVVQMPAAAPGATNTANNASFFSPSARAVQRKCANCEHEEKEKQGIQRKEGGATSASPTAVGSISDMSGKAAPPVVNDVLSSGAGQPMEGDTRQFMESRFGKNFSQVCIHTDNRAAESASAIQARAYTSGRDVVFGSGQYEPSSESGKRLLAHELVHVVQQGGQKSQVQRAEIEYRPLTWSDFKGNAVGKFDAVTSTRIESPSFNKAKPVLTEVDTKEPCALLDSKGNPQKDRKGDPKMSTNRSVNIEMNTDALLLKALMNQNKSATKPFNKNPAVRKNECIKEQTTPCEKFFKAELKAKRQGGSFGSATELKECKTVLQPECEKTKKESADDLLVHEQGHFDLTEAFARSGTTELQQMTEEIGITTVSACGAGAGKKEAEKTLKAGLTAQIKAKIDEIKARFESIAVNKKDPKTGEVTTGELWKTQDEYDTDSNHSQNTAGQATWNHKISDMLNP